MIIVGEHVVNLVLEAATGLFGKTAEEAEDGILAAHNRHYVLAGNS